MLQKIFEGSSKKRTTCCKIRMKFHVIYERFKDILEVSLPAPHSNRTRNDGLCIISSKLEEIHVPQRTFMALSVHTGRQGVFPTPTNPFGDDPEEEEPHDDFTVPQK